MLTLLGLYGVALYGSTGSIDTRIITDPRRFLDPVIIASYLRRYDFELLQRLPRGFQYMWCLMEPAKFLNKFFRVSSKWWRSFSRSLIEVYTYGWWVHPFAAYSPVLA